ncbi:MAG: GNAT family N-acetyltransferase, partial [Oscillospiraceae bacterium]|nr:GNAT family N-acetyltransferase [Oscillospiraceae bacterium]
GDVPALTALLGIAFGDTPVDTARFFASYNDPSLIAVAESDGRFAAAGYLLPVGELAQANGRRAPCAMIYGVATRPEYRLRGLGGGIARRLVETGRARGFDAVVLHPADDGLFAFYARDGLFEEYFTCAERRITAPELANTPPATLLRTEPQSYREIRERLLADCAHIDFDERALRFQAELCGAGGFLRAVELDACAAVEARGGDVFVKELLCAPEARGAEPELLAAIAAAFPAASYTVRVPGDASAPGMRFGMRASSTFGRTGLEDARANPPGAVAADSRVNAWYGLDFN